MRRRSLNIDELGILIFLAALIFGAWFRIMPAWIAKFPVNDGGMLYVMMKDLQANNFAPPLFTTYNNLNIPFAYPPLALYLGAALSSLLKISLLDVLRWLPGVINSLCVWAFYSLAIEILGDKLKGAIATFVFAMVPHMSTWLSMGGGLTRSAGTLFMILTILYAHRLFTRRSSTDGWWTAVYGSLTALSHTEAPIYAALISFFIWAVKSRSISGLKRGILVALGVAALAGPWYAIVGYRHGIGTLVSASQSGLFTAQSALRIINFDFMTEEPYLDILGVLGLLGMVSLIAKRDFFIPGLLAILYLILPRSAHTIGNIPTSMAAGFFIAEVWFPEVSGSEARTEHMEINRTARVLWIVLLPFIFFNSIKQGFQISTNHVSESERNAMYWASENTPPDAEFMIITGEQNGFCDAVDEWFPALARRASLTTLQGREWLSGHSFGDFIGRRAELQGCIDEGIACLDRHSGYFGENADYLYISIRSPSSNCEAADAANRTTRGLILAMEHTSDYSIVYHASDVVIYEKK